MRLGAPPFPAEAEDPVVGDPPLEQAERRSADPSPATPPRRERRVNVDVRTAFEATFTLVSLP